LINEKVYDDLGVYPKDALAGHKTDIIVRNPMSLEDIPVYIANYVVSTYANGAVMGVPSTHLVDAQFYSKVITGDASMFDEKRILLSSDRKGARKLVAEQATNCGFARSKIVYKLRDWLISRQRYWGTPIPIIHCKKCGPVPVDNCDLPVLLPEIEGNDFSKDLVSVRVNEWKKTQCPRFARLSYF
jgi:leucyl-tRNA synthetase